jgi:hypothetical protein
MWHSRPGCSWPQKWYAVRTLLGDYLCQPVLFLCLIADCVRLMAIFVRGETVKKGWQFLSMGWWVVHFLGFTLVYTAGRLTAALMRG